MRNSGGEAVALLSMLALLCSCSGRPPEHLGESLSELAPCPGTPNCVSSEEVGDHAIEPLFFSGEPTVAWGQLQEVIDGMARTKIVTISPGYLHAEFRIAVFGFVDDVECVLRSEDHRIDIRSASRLGRSDLGVNRRRVEKIRKAFGERVR